MSKIITCPNCNSIFDMREVTPTPGPAPTPTPIPTPIPIPPTPSPAPAPSGPLGTKTNPYKMNKVTTAVWGGFIAENENSNAEVGISGGEKIYYEVDPLGVPFKLFVGFFSGAGTVCKLTQDKTTGVYSAEQCQGSDGYFDIVRTPLANTKYLYAIDNSGSPGAVLNKLWVIMPFNP